MIENKKSKKSLVEHKIIKQPIEKIKWEPGVDAFNNEEIPPKYDGASPKKIIEWIELNPSLIDSKKGEFEKQSDFDKRIKAEKIAEENSQANNYKYAFILNDDRFQYGNYDADKEVYIPRSLINSYLIKFESSYSNLGSYIESNAYGAKVSINKFYNVDYGIVLNVDLLRNSNLFDVEGSSFRLNENLSLPLDVAKRIETSNIKFLVSGKIDSNGVSSHSSCIKPKFDNPMDGCLVTKYLIINVDRVIAYIYSTGEVIYNQDLNISN
ncbi:MAG: hypothetical protein WCG50_10595, partial [Rhodoferax sp.]